MTKYFYFYDLNEVLIDRYPAKIASHISSIAKTNNFVFIFSERYNYSNPQNIPIGSKAFYIKNLSKKKLDELVLKYPPCSLTTIAQRIPDVWMLTYFNKLGCPTFTVQHGLWSDRSVRIPIIPLLFGKFSKFINYLEHAQSICKLNNIPLLPTLLDLYRFNLKETIDISETKYLNNDTLRANKAFVFDESWNPYYLIRYGYDIKNLIYIGNPDLLLLKNKDLNNKEDAVCYLCQSLVEDGRFKLDEYIEFLRILINIVATTKKLYIKLHPRSKLEFYNIFESNKNVTLTHDLPICEYYIGHYTSLLETVKQISDNVLIWKLPNHHIPVYFNKFGSVITDNQSELADFIVGKIPPKQEISSSKLSKDQLNQFDPIDIVANNLINLSLK